MTQEQELLSIGAVSDASRLRPSALRFYEDQGLIAPSRRIGGRRHYDPSILRRLAIIAHCQEVGFTISEIAGLLGGNRRRARWQKLAQAKLDELDAHIERAQAARRVLALALECGCGDPASCELVTESAARRLMQLERRTR